MKDCLLNDKKKIAFCLASFRAGGGERVMIDLANAFAERGYIVDIVVLKTVGNFATQVNPAIRVVSLDARRLILSFPKLVIYLQREQPEVFIATDQFTHILALFARRLSGAQTRIVLRIGTMFSRLFATYQGWKNSILRILVKRFYKDADRIIANSHGVADDIINITGVDKKRVSVIYNPKPIDLIRVRAQESVGHVWLEQKTLPVVVAVGRLREMKNFPLIIRAFLKASQQVPARLVIIGGGGEEDRLRALLREYACEDTVSLVGYVDNPHAYMSKADLFVSASLWEGMPNAVLEAMVCGLPVIASDCSSGPREILAPESDYKFRLKKGLEEAPFGILFAVNDEDALTQAILRMLKDTKLRSFYAGASEKRSRDFDTHGIISEYARVMGI